MGIALAYVAFRASAEVTHVGDLMLECALNFLPDLSSELITMLGGIYLVLCQNSLH